MKITNEQNNSAKKVEANNPALKNVKNNKKRKKCENNCNICSNSTKITHISKQKYDNSLLDEAYKTDLVIYIKTLLEVYKSLPNIINIIDKIIEKKASILSTSNIYGNSYLATYNDIDKVINMGDRKNKLLNIYVIIEKLLDSLEDKDRKIAVLKFVQKNTTEEIAKDIGATERTVFRRALRIIEKLSIYALKNNWSTTFIKNQIGNEPWIQEIYNKKKNDESSAKSKKVLNN